MWWLTGRQCTLVFHRSSTIIAVIFENLDNRKRFIVVRGSIQQRKWPGTVAIIEMMRIRENQGPHGHGRENQRKEQQGLLSRTHDASHLAAPVEKCHPKVFWKNLQRSCQERIHDSPGVWQTLGTQHVSLVPRSVLSSSHRESSTWHCSIYSYLYYWTILSFGSPRLNQFMTLQDIFLARRP